MNEKERQDRTLLACKHIASDRLEVESMLSAKRWFGYRFLHPTTLTELFARLYSDQYRRSWQQHMDLEEAPLKKGLGADDVWTEDRATRTAVWTARLCADDLGMPYEFFLNRSFNWLLDGRARCLPRPNQLCREVLAKAVVAQWREAIPHKLFYSTEPQYHNSNDMGTPAQAAHHDWLVQQIRLRHGSPHLIARLCFDEELLPEARALWEFGEEGVAEARALARVPSTSSPASPAADLRPGCYGMPHAYSAAGRECSACPFAAGCEKAVAVNRSLLVSTLGSDDPVTQRKREINRQRQKRFRDRAAATKILTPRGHRTRGH